MLFVSWEVSRGPRPALKCEGAVTVDRKMHHSVVIPCSGQGSLVTLDAEEVVVRSPSGDHPPKHLYLLFDILTSVSKPSRLDQLLEQQRGPGTAPASSMRSSSVVYNSTVQRLHVLAGIIRDLANSSSIKNGTEQSEWLSRIEQEFYPQCHPEATSFFPGKHRGRSVTLCSDVGLLVKPFLPTHRLPFLPDEDGDGDGEGDGDGDGKENGEGEGDGPKKFSPPSSTFDYGAWKWSCINGTEPLRCGIQFDGLVFNLALSRYYPSNTVYNPRVPECSKYKPVHKISVDFLVVRAQESHIQRIFGWSPLFSRSRIDYGIDQIKKLEIPKTVLAATRGEKEALRSAERYGNDLEAVPWNKYTKDTVGDLYLFVPGDKTGGIGFPFARTASTAFSPSNVQNFTRSDPSRPLFAEHLQKHSSSQNNRRIQNQMEVLGVFEFVFHSWRNCWTPKVFRNDKLKGNTFVTVLKTTENIFNPVTQADLIKECSSAC